MQEKVITVRVPKELIRKIRVLSRGEYLDNGEALRSIIRRKALEEYELIKKLEEKKEEKNEIEKKIGEEKEKKELLKKIAEMLEVIK